MFREKNYEMEQLLKSLAKIDKARKECERNFESHIWLDDGVKGEGYGDKNRLKVEGNSQLDRDYYD